MRKRAAIADLPSGVSVIRAVNGRGDKYWKLRIGKRYTGGKPIVKYFPELAEAKEWLLGPEFNAARAPAIEILAVIDQNRGQFEKKADPFWNPERLTAAAAAIQRLENRGLTLESAVDFAIRHLHAKAELLAWDDAIAGAMSDQNAGNRDASAVECGKRWRRLKRWATEKKVAHLNGFTETLAREYMRGKTHLKPTAKKREITYMSMLFSWAVSADKLNLNPWRSLIERTHARKKNKKRTLADETVGRVRIYSIEELIKILALAKYGFLLRAPAEADALEMRRKFKDRYGSYSITVAAWELVPWLCLGIFGGHRPDEAERVVWGKYELSESESILEINFAEALLELPAYKSKTGQERSWPMEPVLGEWLQPCKKSSGKVVPPNFQRKLWALRDAMGWKEWPQDITRHSYASYHLARDKKPHETAHNLGHRDPTMLFAHYKRSLRKPEDVKKFWEMTPTMLDQLSPISRALEIVFAKPVEIP